MAGYQRFALIFDTETGVLGRAAIELIELGIDVLYVNHVDEAALLAQQEAERLAAVLVPADCPPRDVQGLLERVCPYASGVRGLVVVGDKPDAEAVAALRETGLQWALWKPFTPRELRFVMTAAMAADGADRRASLRIPSEIKTSVFSGRHSKDVVIHDLSTGGAYLASDKPFSEGTLLTLDVELPNGQFIGKGEVVYAKTADQEGRPDVPPGMGVVFTKLMGNSENTLLEHIDGWVDRFRP